MGGKKLNVLILITLVCPNRSDFKDAFAMQCIASYMFIYFSCLTPIITFGGLLGDATENRIAAIESLMSGEHPLAVMSTAALLKCADLQDCKNITSGINFLLCFMIKSRSANF